MSWQASAWVWKQEIPLDRKAYLLALADSANPDGYCWVSYSHLMEMTGRDKRNIQRAFRALEADGWLEINPRAKNGRQTSNLYRLRFENGTPPEWKVPDLEDGAYAPPSDQPSAMGGAHATPPVDKSDLGVAPTPPLGAAPTPPSGVAPTPPEPSYEPSINHLGALPREDDKKSSGGKRAAPGRPVQKSRRTGGTRPGGDSANARDRTRRSRTAEETAKGLNHVSDILKGLGRRRNAL